MPEIRERPATERSAQDGLEATDSLQRQRCSWLHASLCGCREHAEPGSDYCDEHDALGASGLDCGEQ